MNIVIQTSETHRGGELMLEEDATDTERSEAPLAPAISGRIAYEIRVKDHLDPCWWHWFEGWSFTDLSGGEVVLRGCVDQSALHGALNKIRDLNLILISVIRMETK
jgi:hypothetical protein